MFQHYGITTYRRIDNYKELIKEQKTEIQKRETIIDSLEQSMVREIKSIVIPYSSKMLHIAWCQQHKPTKAERAMFEFVKDDLLERIFEKDEIKKVKFEDIIPLNYEHCVYSFRFKYKGITFEVSIPNVSVASKDNVSSMKYGMYALCYEKKPSYWDSIIESYNMDDIAKVIHDFVEKG